MADPTTGNRVLATPLRGSDTGVWDTPVNNDFIALDGILGGVATVGLSSVPVTLSLPGTVAPTAGPFQSQNMLLKFTGTLTSNVAVTLAMPGYWMVQNLCSGAFTVTLTTGSGQVIGLPPNEIVDTVCDGTNFFLRGLGRLGSYIDIASSTVPAWVAACTVPPYLLCDGSVYTIAAYPALGAFLSNSFGGDGIVNFGVPDLRARTRVPLAGTSGRISVAGGNFDATILGASGGLQNHTQLISEMPVHNHTINISDPTHTHPYVTVGGQATPNQGQGSSIGAVGSVTSPAATGITATAVNTGSGNPFTILQPTLVSGITLIKT